MRSLFLRIQGAFLIIILLTALIHTGMDYYATYREIPRLLTRVETAHIAEIVRSSREIRGGWEGLEEDLALFEGGLPGETLSLRIIIRDGEGKTVYNSFSRLESPGAVPLVAGSSRTVTSGEGGEPLFSVTAYIGRDYLAGETLSYLAGSLRERLLWGFLLILAVSGLARLFSRRLSLPVAALTEGMERISREGAPETLPVLSRDELGRMSRAFNAMAAALEEQKGLRKKLVSDLSHDIGTPLNSIRLEARGIGDGLTSPEKGARRIVEEVDRLAGMLTDLDWLGETDSGRFELNREEYDPVRLIREEGERWRIRAEARGVELTVEDEGGGEPCLFDVRRMGRALGNLIDNSLRHTPPGGKIALSCRREGNRVILAVEDTGRGMDREILPYIFERFYRGDLSRTPGGRGLGLSIVKQIIELHGGRVFADSAPGEGSRFTLEWECVKKNKKR